MEKNIKLLSWFNFFTDFIPYFPLAVIYYSQIAGSYALGMSIFSITMLSAALFEIPTGVFSDRIGRKQTMVYGALSSCIGTLFIAWGSYLFLVLGAVFLGIARSFYSGNNEAFLHDSLKQLGKENEFSTYLAKTNAPFQIAMGISAITGSIIAYWSLHAAVWITIIPQLLALFISLRFTEPSIHDSKSTNIYDHLWVALKQFKINKRLRYLSIASIIRYGLGEAAFVFRFAFISTVWPIWALGLSSTLSHIGSTIGYFVSKSIFKRFSIMKILVGEILINRVINFAALLFPTIISPILISGTSFFWSSAEIAKSTILQKEFTQEQRATMGSITSFAGNILFAISAFIMGIAADVVGPRNVLILIQVLFLSTLYFYHLLQKELKKTI